MIDDRSMLALLRRSLPDAELDVYDLTGTMDHFEVFVRSSAFKGKTPMDRHRMVEAAFRPAREDGRIHALAIKTALLEN